MENIAHAVRTSGRRHRDLARLLGLTPQQFSDRMHGRTRWTLTEAADLALALGISLDELYGGEAA